MRVALDVSAVPDRPAGAGVYVVELVRALAARGGLDLHLVTRRADTARWEALAPGAALHPRVPKRRPVRLAWEQALAPGVARAAGATVWHGPHYTMPLRCPVPAVVTVHDLTLFDHPELHERAKVWFFRRMIRAATRRAAVLVSVSASTARRLEELLAPDAPVLVVPHGIDHDRFRPLPPPGAPDDLDLLARLGVRPPFVAFVGTIEPRKNVPALVRAFTTLAGRHPDLQLVIAGGRGWDGGALDRSVAASGLDDRVRRLGYVDDAVVPALYRRAAAVVYPALAEGFGLPALEALACGAPLVTTTGSAMEELVGDAALLVPAGDDAALTGALATALDEPGVAGRLRAAGPRQAAPYTWARCAERHVEAYRLAATAPTPSPPA